MSITQKALQFALEAQHEHQEDLAEAILGEVDIGSLGIKDADEDSIIQLINAFVEVDLLPAAVKALSHAVKHKHRFGENVYSPLLTALARKGAWRYYNRLLCLMTECADEKTLRQISHHLLNQLEIEKASKTLGIQGSEASLRILRKQWPTHRQASTAKLQNNSLKIEP